MLSVVKILGEILGKIFSMIPKEPKGSIKTLLFTISKIGGYLVDKIDFILGEKSYPQA